MNRIMVTGHRKLTPLYHEGKEYPYDNKKVYHHHITLYRKMLEWLNTMVSDDTDLINGMAIGADQLFGWASVTVKALNPSLNITTIAAIPFEGQESLWNLKTTEMYNKLKSKMDQVYYISKPPYSPAKMMKRNTWMLDRADIVLAVWDGTNKGGTWNTVDKALRIGRTLYVMNPYTGQIGKYR